MATNITIKRWDSTANNNAGGWVELSPATTIAQVSGLQTALDAKEVLSNKVTSVDNLSTNDQYPSAKLFYDTTKNIMEVAEGKTKTFVTDLVAHTESDVTSYYIMGQTGGDIRAVGTDIQYSTAGLTPYLVDDSTDTLDFVNYLCWYCVELHTGTGNSAYYTIKWVIDCSNGDWIGANDTGGDIHIGDNLLITDTNVPDYWFTDTTGIYLSKLETSKVPLEDYVPLAGTNAMAGSIVPSTNNSISLGSTGTTSSDAKAIKDAAIMTVYTSSGGLEARDGIYSSSASLKTKYGYGSIVNKNYTLTLPTTTGTIALTSDFPVTGVVDGLFDLEVTNKSITVAPYTSQQGSILSMDTSQTPPSRTDRLNINGSVYVTSLNSGTITPSANGTRDLGTTSYKWGNLYLSGNLSDGTKSDTVATLVGKTTVFYQNSEPSSSTTNLRNGDILFQYS